MHSISFIAVNKSSVCLVLQKPENVDASRNLIRSLGTTTATYL